MKIQDLTEVPNYIDREMISVHDTPAFISNSTITELFTIVESSGEYMVLLRKDKSRAEIVKTGIRNDGTAGAIPFGHVDFKTTSDLSWTSNIHLVRGKCLQVDGVEIITPLKQQGFGSFIYLSLVKAGYTIISDTTHYLGGRKLWGKLARSSHADGTRVLIADNGAVVCAEYNGYNYPQDQIWGPSTSGPKDSKKHVLLILTK